MPHFGSSTQVLPLNSMDRLTSTFAATHIDTYRRQSASDAHAIRRPGNMSASALNANMNANQGAIPLYKSSWTAGIAPIAPPVRRGSSFNEPVTNLISDPIHSTNTNMPRLRPTAPSFPISTMQRNDNQYAIIDEEDDDVVSQGTLDVRRTSTVWTEPGLRSIWRSPSGHTEFEVPRFATKPGERKVDSPLQDLYYGSVPHVISRDSTPGERFMHQTIPTPVNGKAEAAKKFVPRKATFPPEALAKLGSWEPTYTQADLRDNSATRFLHTSNNCFAVVEFKLFRADVYQVRMDLPLVEGVSLVIVEADRGTDLGKVFRLTQDIEEARAIKKQLFQRHWDALLRHSRFAEGNESTFKFGFETYYHHHLYSTHATGFNGNAAPKSIISQANQAQIEELQIKEGLEERAKRDCQKKSVQIGQAMEVLAAEFQFDRQKLTLYYLSSHYIQYQQLQNEVFKLYKCRLWFSALNPCSFFPTKGDQGNARRRSGEWHAPAGPVTAQGTPIDSSQINLLGNNFPTRFRQYAGELTGDGPQSTFSPPSPWNSNQPDLAMPPQTKIRGPVGFTQ